MFRITPLSSAQTAIFQNRNHVGRLGHLQYQASSGLKYSRPSENPGETHSIGLLNRTMNSLQTQLARMDQVKQPLNNSVTNLLQANNLITRAKQIALEAPQTLGQGDRSTLAAEVDSLIERFQAIANSKYQNRYLYSGTASDTEPFQLDNDSRLAIPHVTYGGSSQNADTVISESISIRTTFSGEDVFLQRGRGDTLFFGNTGAAQGSGTDSEIGRVNLTVSHTLTTYAAGSGVATGLDSVGGDSVVGDFGRHSLFLRDTTGNGAAGFVSLNGGLEVAWTSSNDNLQLTGPQGESVYIDTTSIAAGFVGTVNITATGTLSTDGGASEVPIDFSGNQVIHNSLTGGVTNVDSTGIVYAGNESVEFQGTADAITVLLELKDDLLNNRGLADAEVGKSFDRRLADLNRISDHLLEVVGEQSVALQNLDQMSVQNENQQLELGARLGELESADLAKVIVEMQAIQTTMQFNYAALSIVQSNNLLDFLG